MKLWQLPVTEDALDEASMHSLIWGARRAQHHESVLKRKSKRQNCAKKVSRTYGTATKKGNKQ
jgi:hypothetical protein